MSTLTALKLERELEIARRAIAVWTQVRETVDPAATPAGTFA
jgi:hypothetical protein